MLSTLLTLFVIGILGIVVFSVIMALIGTMFSLAFGLVGFLLFKVAPVLLIGWVVLKLVERSRRRQSLSTSDQKWLDG